jgi:hypothetical protein
MCFYYHLENNKAVSRQNFFLMFTNVIQDKCLAFNSACKKGTKNLDQ